MRILRRTQVPYFAKYEKYKSLLREDFQYRCAYCRHHERVFALLQSMTIDHFRPKSRFPHLRVQYSNLYYCCCECNTIKGDKWPSDEEFAADSRFVDVCVDEWDEHIKVHQDVMVPKTALGRFTVEQLRLDRPKLTRRNRDLAARESRIRDQLRRVDEIRERWGPDVDALTIRDLNELERSLQNDLRELVSPLPLED